MTIYDSVTDAGARAGAIASIDHFQADGAVAETAVPVGVVVVRGTAATQCKVPASDAETQKPLGVSKLNLTRITEAYSIGEALDIVRDGEIYVVCEDAIAHGDTVYVRHTANGAGKLVLGAIRSDADSGNASVALGITPVETTTGAGVCKCRVFLPCNAPLLADLLARIVVLETP